MLKPEVTNTRSMGVNALHPSVPVREGRAGHGSDMPVEMEVAARRTDWGVADWNYRIYPVTAGRSDVAAVLSTSYPAMLLRPPCPSSLDTTLITRAL